jgi:transcription elongation GreA/GreB family factor
MNRAFVKESEGDTVDIPERPISSHPNFVTEGGLTAIESALHRFEAAYKAAVAKGNERAAAADLREMKYWRARLASAQLVKASRDISQVHFGASVTIRREDGREQTYRIVGEDEADPSRGTVSHVSPIAQAVMGRAVGETVEIIGREAKILKIGS